MVMRINRLFLPLFFAATFFSNSFAEQDEKAVENNNSIETVYDIISEAQKKDPWEFIGNKFYDGLKNEINLKSWESDWKESVSLFSFLGALFPLPLLALKDVLGYGVGNWETATGLVTTGALVVNGIVFSILYSIAKDDAKDYGYEKVLYDFLSNWDEFKKYTPEELHDAFDSMKKSYGDKWEEISLGGIYKFVNFVREKLLQNSEVYANKFNRKEQARLNQKLVNATYAVAYSNNFRR